MKSMKTTLMALGMTVMSASIQPAFAGQVQTGSDAKITVDSGKAFLYNNKWGGGEVPTGTQEVYYNSGNDYGWRWNWPSTTTTVKGYPSVVSGWHWTAGYTPNSGLPVKLAAHKRVDTNVTYAFVNTTGAYNAAYDLWFHTINNATWANDPTDEVMVWLNRNGDVSPAGSYKETVTLAGTQWDLYVGHVSSWNVYSFVRKVPATSAALNMTDFTDYLQGKQYLSQDKYLSSVEFGTEIYNGSGAFRLFDRQVNVK